MRYTQSLILVGMLVLSRYTVAHASSKTNEVVQMSEDDFFDFDLLDAQLEGAGTPAMFAPEKDPSSIEVALRRIGMPILLMLLRTFSSFRSLLAFLYALFSYPFRAQ